jgi:hypothetical protein
MNRIYAALAAISLLASPAAFAKSRSHVAKAPVADKAEGKTEVKADAAKTDEAKPADGEKKTSKKTKKPTKKAEEKAPEAAPAK